MKQIDTVHAKIKVLPFNIKPTYYFVVDADGKVRQKFLIDNLKNL